MLTATEDAGGSLVNYKPTLKAHSAFEPRYFSFPRLLLLICLAKRLHQKVLSDDLIR